MSETTKGILILALGHAYFGRLAHNLAVSIKAVEPDMPIALVWAGHALDHLKVFHLADTFDYVIEATAESFTRNGKAEYIKSKTFIYDFSPFDETLYLDADTIWLHWHKPTEIFNQLQDVDFTAECRGFVNMADGTNDYIRWARMDEIRAAYELPEDAKYYQVSSEFIYFKKSERVAGLFEHWKDNYDNLKIPVRIPQKSGPEITEFSGGIPDELPLSIAMMQTGIYPHKETFVPVFWQTYEKKIPSTLQHYYALSMGGKVTGDWSRKQYDNINQHNMNAAGLRYIWKSKNKRSFLPERQKI